MKNIIKFSARGTEFSIPKKMLENYPESMLYIISNTCDQMPVDKIDECIYIDVNTFSIDTIIDYYSLRGIMSNYDMYTCMDLKYLGINVNTMNALHIVPDCMMVPIIYNEENDANNILSKYITRYKYCRLHTSNNRIIIIDISSYSNRNIKIFESIIYTDPHEDTNETLFFDAWIGLNDRIVNIIMSILRDGLNMYYKYLETSIPRSDETMIYNFIKDMEYVLITKSDHNDEDDISDSDCGCGCWQNSRRVSGGGWEYDKEYNPGCPNCRENYRDRSRIYIHKKICSGEKVNFNTKIKYCINKMSVSMDELYDKTEQLCNNMAHRIKLLEHMTYIKFDPEENKKVIHYLKINNICDDYVENQLQNRY